ncbi:hypothetical protein [Segatella hominis]|uniref:hypothetical protein n=3 Tax=Segatella hominis TaxID=2518605 RepID=UPI003AAECD54
MIFLKTSKQEILQCIGEVLEKSYGKDYDSVLPMFADTDCPMPEIFKEPSEERNKQLEDRFLYCITEAAIKDNFDELQAFLKGILERLRESYVGLRTVGYKWLVDFLCDDKKSFLHLGIYLKQAAIFGEDAEKFYKKFTNTQKHNKKHFDANGTPIYHSIFAFSPVTSSEYIYGIITIEEYGERYIAVANLYKDIIYVLSEAYQYVMTLDQMACMRKQFPEQCQNSLIKLVDEVKRALCEAAINPDILIPTQAQKQEARDFLPQGIYKKIFELDIKTLSTTLYHEVPTKYKKAFGILVIERIKMQQNVDDIEYLVFKHITNPDELIEKVNNARLILAHINEFAMLDIIEDGKCKKEKVLKGTIACLFYLWTGTKMSQSDFLEKYYSIQCKDEKLHVKQSTLSTAISNLDSQSPLRNGFNAKVNDIIGKNQVTPAKMVEIKSCRTTRKNVAGQQSV